jgi:hypothetical protein
MKFRIKKYFYLINDLTNIVLNKDREEWHEKYRELLYLTIILAFILIISLAFNFYFYFSC